jgi:hypothetical protein
MPLSKVPESILPGESVGAGATSSYSSTVNLTQAIRFAVTAAVTYAGSGVTQPCILQVFASMTGGADFDTYPYVSVPIPLPDGGGTGRMTVGIPADVMYVRCNIVNPDPAIGVTSAQIHSVKQIAS